MNTELILFIIAFLLTIMFICVIILSISNINLHISLKSLQNSTHNVEYIPIDPKWASSDKDIDELNERSELEMPDLDQDELDPSNIDLNKMI